MGESVAEGVVEAVECFGFQVKLGGLQAGNAENNDTCITKLPNHLNR
jgi:hypothetical protein